MTVSSTSSRVVLAGNGSTTVFSFAFKVLAAADLVVIYTDANGNNTTLTSGQYTDANSYPLTDAGGQITYNPNGTPIAAGTTLTIYRNEAATQPSSINNQGAMWPQVIEQALDRIVLLVQQFIDGASRSLQISPTDGTTLNPLPTAALRANSYLAFDANGQPVAATSIGNTPASTFWGATLLLTTASASLSALGGLAASLFTTAGDLLIRGATTVQRLGIGTTGQVLTVVSGLPAWTTLSAIAPSTAGVRQSVNAGPVDTNGLPTFLPATATGLTLTQQNISSTYPFVASAANGWNSATGIPVDTVGFSVTALAWTLANSSSLFLYVAIGANGAMTPGSTTLAPIYQWGGTPSTTNGQFTFNISEMRGYMGNGTTAPQANIVFVGEAVTSGGNITSTVSYAYNGQYDSGFTATLPTAATAVSKNHNIGVPPRVKEFIIECTTNDGGYVVGEQISASAGVDSAASTVTNAPAVKITSKTIAVVNGSGVAWLALNGSGSGAQATLTLASWKYKFVANRGW